MDLPVVILLFYKYVSVPNLTLTLEFLRKLCADNSLTGRILLGRDGINGNLAGLPGQIAAFTAGMDAYQTADFSNISWKYDTLSAQEVRDLKKSLFPDLKIVEQSEICSTGHNMPASLLLDQGLGGNHLDPEDFHATLESYWGKGSHEPRQIEDKKKLVVIDVRNRKEFAIGRFQNPSNPDQCAVDPNTKTFAQFADFNVRMASELKDCKVLVYCSTLRTSHPSLGADVLHRRNPMRARFRTPHVYP
jgi:UPF0176 protein